MLSSLILFFLLFLFFDDFLLFLLGGGVGKTNGLGSSNAFRNLEHLSIALKSMSESL